MEDGFLKERSWARYSVAHFRRKKGLSPYRWKTELSMGISEGTWCVECEFKGHHCKAEVFLDQEIDNEIVTKIPYCLDCANGRPCSYREVDKSLDSLKVKKSGPFNSRVRTGHRLVDVEKYVIEDNGRTAVQDIATKYNVSISTVSRYRREHKIVSQPKPVARTIKTTKTNPLYEKMLSEKHPGIEQAVIDDAGCTKDTVLAVRLKCKPWLISYYRRKHSMANNHIESRSDMKNIALLPTETVPVEDQQKVSIEIPKIETRIATSKGVSYEAVLSDLEEKLSELDARRKNIANAISVVRSLVQTGAV